MRATRVMHRVLMTDRRSLLEQVVKDKKGWEELKNIQAEFVDQKDGQSVVELDPATESLPPADFWENPTALIERQLPLLPI